MGDLRALRETAEAARRDCVELGPWFNAAEWQDVIRGRVYDEDTEYLAAFDPETVLALIAKVEAADRLADAASKTHAWWWSAGCDCTDEEFRTSIEPLTDALEAYRRVTREARTEKAGDE